MRILIAGGGTGGHLIPALNIARELARRDPDSRILFAGTSRGIEKDIVPAEGFPLELMPVVPLSRKPGLAWVKFPFALLKSVFKMISAIRRIEAQVVVATGGYVSGPGVLAGWLAGIPVVMCEQNSFPGLTTRMGSLFASCVCLGLPGAREKLWRSSRAVFTGNPVEMESRIDRAEAAERFGLNRELPILLVTGGSQGAQRINTAVIEWFRGGFPAGKLQMIWQTGAGKFERATEEAGRLPDGVVAKPFIRPMSDAYSAANLVVARCGALTLSEIAVFGLPSILVPYPYAAADHQRKNALEFERSGAGVVIEDNSLDGESLSKTVAEIATDSSKLKQMSEAALELGQPDALARIADIVEETAST